MDHSLSRLSPHPARLGVKTNQTGNVRFSVLGRMNVGLGGLLDEIPVKDLPAVLLVKKPLGADLTSGYSCTGGPASAEMIEASIGAVHKHLQKPAMTITGPDYDADDRGPSAISRELRCPDR
jgi:hypothetical protein